jgi:hypothetical protein
MSDKTVKEIVKQSNRKVHKLSEEETDAEYERLHKEEKVFWVSTFGDFPQFKKFLVENLPSSEYYIEYHKNIKEYLIHFRVKK